MRPSLALATAFLGLIATGDDVRLKLSDCPPAVRSTFQAEAKHAKIEAVTKEVSDDDETVYWADVVLGERTYAIGVLQDGTLSEMNLAIGDHELPFDRCPAAVKETLGKEAFGEKVEEVELDRKYGVTIYEAVVKHDGKSYELVVAEDGSLVEKVLMIEDDPIELTKCPAAVQAAFHKHAKGGKIRDVMRSTGIGRPTYEAEVGIKNRVYLVEIDEAGALIAMSLEATDE